MRPHAEPPRLEICFAVPVGQLINEDTTGSGILIKQRFLDAPREEQITTKQTIHLKRQMYEQRRTTRKELHHENMPILF